MLVLAELVTARLLIAAFFIAEIIPACILLALPISLLTLNKKNHVVP